MKLTAPQNEKRRSPASQQMERLNKGDTGTMLTQNAITNTASLFIDYEQLQSRRSGRTMDKWGYVYASYTRRYIRLTATPQVYGRLPTVKLFRKSRIGHAAAMEWATNYAKGHQYKIYLDDPVELKMSEWGYMPVGDCDACYGCATMRSECTGVK